MKIQKPSSNKFSRFWNLLGPGLVTGASDDDPSGIATYSQAGAAYGLSTLWTALITFPLMASIQEMCARIGLVTSHGLAGTLKTNYSKPVLYLMLLFSFPAIVMNIGADIAGMGAVGNLLFPVSYTHLRAHETKANLVCRLLLEKKKNQQKNTYRYAKQVIEIHDD